MDGTEETGGPPQRTEALPPAADLPARGPPQTEIPGGWGERARKPACQPAGHGGKGKRQGTGRWPTWYQT